MKRWKSAFFSLVLSAAMLLSLCVPSFAAQEADLDALVTGTGNYMYTAVSSPQVGSIGGEWAVIGLARSGVSVPQSYWDTYYASVVTYVKARNGVLHEKKYTEYSRLILALTAIGADPTNVAGYNLVAPLADYDQTVWQGVNGAIWALIALDSGNYDLPTASASKVQATRQKYVDAVLATQGSDGGWSISGRGSADPDMTAMALQALAPYQSQKTVSTAVARGITCLSGLQSATGGFATGGEETAESAAQVLVALCTLGISVRDSRFVKNGNTVLTALLSYRKSDGSFRHVNTATESNQMATEQGFYALVAARRAQQGKSALYVMNDVTLSVDGGGKTVGLPGKHAAVTRVPVSVPGKTFSDVTGHASRTAIEALAARGIIDGMDTSHFAPNQTMTRAQFCAIVVRALGLTPKATNAFRDVASSKWYASYVGTASTFGIINGRGNGIFDPEGTITRQDAALMVSRAAALCGMDTAMSDEAVRDVLAQFSDYRTADSYARAGLAFCYQNHILNESDLKVEPKRAILRCEIAEMLYRLLDCAELL